MCQLTQKHMGQLVEHLIKDFRISRERQDQYSFESHRKAAKAWGSGKFSEEVVPVSLPGGRWFTKDERPRKNITKQALSHFPPAFEKQGTVTAGNSSAPSDGAASLLLGSSRALKDYDLKACARLLGYASIALEPQKVFTAGVVSIRECLKGSGLSSRDFDLFEISEAFAAQAILTRDQLKIPEEKMNVWGGDIALGHPLGAAGARILVTLIHALRDRRKKKGLVCVCLGGGGAVSVAVEAVYSASP
jgi:acetyl-CoA C-acetyltransferase